MCRDPLPHSYLIKDLAKVEGLPPRQRGRKDRVLFVPDTGGAPEEDLLDNIFILLNMFPIKR